MLLFQVHHDPGTPPLPFYLINGITTGSIALPAQMFLILLPRMGKHLHFISNHISTVKPYPKLTDHVWLGSILRFLKKRLGPRVGNCAQILRELIAGHADPVIRNGNRPCSLVSSDVYLKRKISLKYLILSQLSHPKLLQGIGGVGN